MSGAANLRMVWWLWFVGRERVMGNSMRGTEGEIALEGLRTEGVTAAGRERESKCKMFYQNFKCKIFYINLPS